MSAPPQVARAATSIACAAALALSMTGCTDADPGAAGHDPAAAHMAAITPVAVATRVTRVAGELAPARRQQVAKQVRSLLEEYIQAAYLGDRSPGGDQAAFPGFTRGARVLAAKDARVLTGAGLGDADRVTPGRATAYVAVVAPHRRPVGATARISVELDVTTDAGTRTVTVAGRLLLTPTAYGWRIFGYHLTRSGGGSAGGAA